MGCKAYKKQLGVLVKDVEKLHNYLLRMGVSKAQFALELGVTREAVRSWCTGERFPTLLHVAEIERMTNGYVTARSFYNTEMLEKLDRQGGGEWLKF